MWDVYVSKLNSKVLIGGIIFWSLLVVFCVIAVVFFAKSGSGGVFFYISMILHIFLIVIASYLLYLIKCKKRN